MHFGIKHSAKNVYTLQERGKKSVINKYFINFVLKYLYRFFLQSVFFFYTHTRVCI